MAFGNVVNGLPTQCLERVVNGIAGCSYRSIGAAALSVLRSNVGAVVIHTRINISRTTSAGVGMHRLEQGILVRWSLRNVLNQKIDERSDPRREMFMPGKDSVNHFCVSRVIILENWDKQPGVDIWLDVELANASKPTSGEAKPADDHSTVHRHVTGNRKTVDIGRPRVTERPLVETLAKIETKAVVVCEVLR